MSDSPPTPELLRSLGRLARGLSVLFWGLPVAVLVCVATAREDFLRPFNIAPPVIALAWLLFGLSQLGHFQKQERIWRAALDRAKALTISSIGLSPFLFWFNRSPDVPFFNYILILHGATGLVLLGQLNAVLVRLTAMLPEETLREETKQFAAVNRTVILSALLSASVFGFLNREHLGHLLPLLRLLWLNVQEFLIWKIIAAVAIFLLLSPLAITMALIWKTKEVILDSVFGGQK